MSCTTAAPSNAQKLPCCKVPRLALQNAPPPNAPLTPSDAFAKDPSKIEWPHRPLQHCPLNSQRHALLPGATHRNTRAWSAPGMAPHNMQCCLCMTNTDQLAKSLQTYALAHGTVPCQRARTPLPREFPHHTATTPSAFEEKKAAKTRRARCCPASRGPPAWAAFM